jgi:hypothetical protein
LASPQLKDEGYMSNPPVSAGNITPLSQMRKDGVDLGGLDEMLSEAGFYGARSTRNVSGNSHGMPSPLYDSSTGHGMERIQSKDIVALMEHVSYSAIPSSRQFANRIGFSSLFVMLNATLEILRFSLPLSEAQLRCATHSKI